MSNSALNQAFLEGCQQQELRLQKCRRCEHVQFYPRIACSQCASNTLDQLNAEGGGKVLSYTVIRQAIAEHFQEYLPYTAILVELNEGPTMMSVLWPADADADQTAEVGAKVELDFYPWGGEQLRPVFRLV